MRSSGEPLLGAPEVILGVAIEPWRKVVGTRAHQMAIGLGRQPNEAQRAEQVPKRHTGQAAAVRLGARPARNFTREPAATTAGMRPSLPGWPIPVPLVRGALDGQ